MRSSKTAKMANKNFANPSSMTRSSHDNNRGDIPLHMKTTSGQPRRSRVSPLHRLMGLVTASLLAMGSVDAMACAGHLSK